MSRSAPKLSILGTSSPYPGPGRACPGYLLSFSGHRVLIECGSGAAARLAGPGGRSGFEDLDAVLLSHLHGDHMSDILVAGYALERAMSEGWLDAPVAVYAPDVPAELAGLIPYKAALEFRPIRQAAGASPGRLEIGPFEIELWWMHHSIPTLGMRISAGGGTLAYSADTSRCESLMRLAEGADLFLCEATLPEHLRGAYGHLSASEAAVVARECGVRELLLTHLWPGFEESGLLETGQKEFPGARIAREGETYRF